MTRARDVANIDGILTTTGDTYYASAASTPARLGVGSTGNVLTVSGGVPVWSAPSSPTVNYTLINTGGTALTGATNITVSGFSGYSAIVIRVQNASAGASSSIKVTVNDASGGATAIESNFYVTDSATNTIDVDFGNGTYWLMNYSAQGNAGDNRVDGVIQINNANSTGIKPYVFGMQASNSTGGISNIGNGFITNANAITSVLINSTIGNFDGGTIFVYGAS